MSSDEKKEIVLESGEPDFECNGEFWEEGETFAWTEHPDGVQLQLTGIQQTLSATWDGKELIIK